MEIVSKTDIQEYAKRNTSPKVPIESKYVEAYVDSLLNSTSFQEVYEDILSKVQSKNQFLVFNSYWSDAPNINSEPYRSILAYAMLKKDFFLFQLIAYNMFTGTVEEFFGEDLFTDIVENTDEYPIHYTDQGTFTDMSGGTIVIGFKNIYSPETLEDGTGTEYQTQEEYEEALTAFTSLITMVKPARLNIILFHIPYCFLTGDGHEITSLNINTEDEFFESPFANPSAITALKDLTLDLLYDTYKTVTYGDPSISGEEEQEISYTREIEKVDNDVIFSYEIRIKAGKKQQEEGGEVTGEIWDKHVIIHPGDTSNVLYIEAKSYQEDKTYCEGYRPIMLKLNDDPVEPGQPIPVLAFDAYSNIGALLYTRYKANEGD